MAKKAIRPIRIEGNIAYVPLTQGYEAIIDAADVPLVSGYNWSTYGTVPWVYAATAVGPKGAQRRLYMHRVLLNPADHLLVDHISGDGLDNRRSNLRCATHAENARNRRQNIGDQTPKGVSWREADKRWQVRIRVDGKQIWIGRFSDKDEATAAYRDASLKHHGEFGRT